MGWWMVGVGRDGVLSGGTEGVGSGGGVRGSAERQEVELTLGMSDGSGRGGS